MKTNSKKNIMFVFLLYILLLLTGFCNLSQADSLVEDLPNPQIFSNNMLDNLIRKNNPVINADAGFTPPTGEQYLDAAKRKQNIQADNQRLLRDDDKPDITKFDDRDLKCISTNSSGDETFEVYTIRGLFQAMYDSRLGYYYGNNNIFTIDKKTGKYVAPISPIKKIIIKNDLDIGAFYDDYVNGKQNTNKNWSIDSNTAKMFGLQGRGSPSGYRALYTRHGHLVIDGDNHTVNFGRNVFAIYKNENNYYQENYQIKNLKCYCTDYYGVVSPNSGHAYNYGQGAPSDQFSTNSDYSHLTYGPNVQFVGAQITWSANDCTQIDIDGKVTAKSVPFYAYHGYIYMCQHNGGIGDQQIFQAYRVRFLAGCNFTGYTVNASAVESAHGTASNHSQVILEDGAKVKIYPHATDGEAEDTRNGQGWGIAQIDSNSDLKLYGSAQLSVECNLDPVNAYISPKDNSSNKDDVSDAVSVDYKAISGAGPRDPDTYKSDYFKIGRFNNEANYATGAWYMGSKANINFYPNAEGDSPEFNVISKGPLNPKDSGDHLIHITDGTANLSNGKFSVDATEDLDDFTGSIMYIGGTSSINVSKGGDFSIAGGGSNRITLLEAGNSFGVSINNPKNVSLDLRKNTQRVGRGNSDTFFNGKSTNSGKASNIVTTSAGTNSPGIIDARDISLQAEGDSTTSPTKGGAGKYPPQQPGVSNAGNLVDLGMKPKDLEGRVNEYPDGVLDETKTSTYGTTPKKVQRVQLPFVQDLIYASNLSDGTNKIYLYSNQINNDATDFARVMKEMGGKEFDYVKFSGLNTSQLTRFPLGITPGFKEINGQVTTVKNNDSSTDDIDPNPPKIRLVLTGVKDEATKKTFNIDLGTMFNKKAGFWGYYDKSHNDAATEVEVTPDLIKADGSLDEQHAGKEITSSTDNDPNNPPNPRPRYLDDDTEKKAGDKGDSNSVVTWHDKNNFTINLSQAFKKYNAYAEDYNKNPANTEKLPKLDYPDVPDNLDDPKMTEEQKQQWEKFKNALKDATFSLSTVTNFQESRATDIKVAPFYFNIDDNRSDNPDHVYLLGQTILLPIYYIDGNENVKGLHFQGSIVDQDNKPVSMDNKELTNVDFPEIPFNNNLRNQELFKKVPLGTGLTQPDQLKGASEATFTVKIQGNDVNKSSGTAISYWPADRNKTVDYQYKLLRLPYFQAQSIIKDKTKKKLKFDGEPQYPNFKPIKDKDYYYTVETRFEALADQPVSSIKFDHLSSDSNVTNVIDNEHPVTVNMKSSAVDKTITLNVNNSSNLSGDTLTPADFGLDSTDFPKATTFTFTHYFKFNSTAPYTTFQLGSDRMINESSNYPDQILGKSEALKGYIAGADSGTGDTQDTKALKLQVPTEITFGDYLAFSKAAHRDGYRYSKNGKVVKGQSLKITNENSKSIQASLNAQLVGLPIFHIEKDPDGTAESSKTVKEYFGYQMAFPIKDDNGDDNYEPINMEPSIVYSGNIPGGQPLDLTDKVANNFYFRTLKNDPLYLSAAEAAHWKGFFGTKEGKGNDKLFINWTLVSSLNN